MDSDTHIDVVYLCDRKACGDECPSLSKEGDPCNHTSDITHAISFIEISPGKFAEINESVINFLKEN